MPTSGGQKTPLEVLSSVVNRTVSHIRDFTKHPGDFTRNRKLNAEKAIKVTLNMEGQSLNTELIHAFPDMDDRITMSAYEQAKAKLSPDLFMHILYEYNKTDKNPKLLDGKYMIFAIDGSDFNIPYQSKSKYVCDVQSGRPKKDGTPTKPFCQMHGNILFNLMDRTYSDVIIQPKSSADERSAAIDLMDRMHPKHPYIIIMDRGYDGFNMIEHGNRLNGNGYYIIRTKSGLGGIREIQNLPDKECDVDMDFFVTTSGQFYMQNKDSMNIHLVKHSNHQYKKYLAPSSKNQRWDFKQFEHVKCRVVKFRINDQDTGKQEWEVLLTNLNRFEFPLLRMKKMYHMRWDIETSFRELKYSLQGVQFHSRKSEFCEMELVCHFIIFNVVSRTISQVHVPQSDQRKYEYVVSFKEAATLIRLYFRLYCKSPPDRIFQELLGYIRPKVSGRADKRNIKPKTAVWFVYRVA